MSNTQGALDIVEKWLKNSPSHAFQRLGRAQTLIERLFWSYMIWVSTVLMATFIATVIIKYQGNPTKIHLSVRQDQDPTEFPAVTFCNINTLRDDRVLNDVKKPSLPGATPLAASSLNESEYSKAFADYIDRILAEQASGVSHGFVKWSYKLDDLLITCIFNRRLCFRNLTLLFHPNYGNCYTFDHSSHVEIRETNQIRHDWSVDDLVGGKNYKLYLELFLHQQEYNSYFDDRAAFRLFIHRKHELPMLSETSLVLGPNRYTKLSFSKRILSFSRHCRNTLTAEMKRIFPRNQVRYTQALCIKLCQQRFIETHCRCIEPTLLVFYQFYSNEYRHEDNHTFICSIEDECLKNRTYFNSTRFCGECLPECELVQYRVQSSYASYPNVKAFDQVWQRVRNHFRSDRNVTDYLNQSEGTPSSRNPVLRGNIVAVEISVSPHVTEILTESPMYTWVDLISSIGGQAGLWLGVSLINLLEITELILLLLRRLAS